MLNIPGVDFSITSLRASSKSAEIIALMKGHKSVSIAPEAGTERLRRVINKRITEEDILSTAGALFSGGIETLRLYFMVGLPTESNEDIEGIMRSCTKNPGDFETGFHHTKRQHLCSETVHSFPVASDGIACGGEGPV